MIKQATTVLALGIGTVSLTSVPSSAKIAEFDVNFQGNGPILEIGFEKKHHRHLRYMYSYDDSGDYYYGGHCQYYKMQAGWSGSRYWWKKYSACMRRNRVGD